MSSGLEPQPPDDNWAQILDLKEYLYTKRAQQAHRRRPDPDQAELVGWTGAGYAVRDPGAFGAVIVVCPAEAADLIGISVEVLDLLARFAVLPMPNQWIPVRRRRPPAIRGLKPNIRITGKKRAEVRKWVVARYVEDHVSIRAIAAEINRSYGFVLDLLTEAEVQLRPPGVVYGPGRRQAPHPAADAEGRTAQTGDPSLQPKVPHG